MAYFNQEMKKAKAPAIKALAKKYGVKVSLGVHNHRSFVATIRSGEIDFGLTEQDRGYRRVNRIENVYTGLAKEFLTELSNIMIEGNWDNPYLLKAV